VIAGQGTIAMELLRQQPEGIDAIFVPVGGGGLIAASPFTSSRCIPEISIIGVEPEDAPACTPRCAGERGHARARGHLPRRRGGAPVGEETFRLAQQLRGRESCW
jgi:threonine dehydratase